MSTTGTNGFKTSNVVQTDAELKKLPDTYYAPFLTQSAKERAPNAIWSLQALEKIPGVISLLAGMPSPIMFPLTSLSFTARAPHSSAPADETLHTLTEQELALGLQYNTAAGILPLRNWLYELQEKSHGRKVGEGWSVSVGGGSQDLIFKAVQALVNDGDSVLVESPVYAGVLPMFQTLHCDLVEVQTDARGISAASLREKLETWPAEKPRPKILYTVPYGCNPTGMTAALERRVEVLELAREYDFIILEDDPYFYLYYGTADRPPSYFSLEKTILPETGRVLRFDSFSKILSAGLRLGFASGPAVILEAIDRHVIAYKLLESWGQDGFIEHTRRVSEFYRQKKDIFQAAMKKYLEGYAEWVEPEAGMFFWFKLNLTNDGQGQDQGDSETVIRTTAVQKGVLALPGKAFLPNGNTTAYVRASFSLNPEEEVYEAVKRLRAAVIEFRGQHLAPKRLYARL